MSESPELVLDGGDPIQVQIESQIRRLVSNGALRPGEELPTVREVAVGLGVSPRAVEQAYNQLTRVRVVTWTDSGAPRVTLPASGPQGDDLMHLCEGFLRQATRYGYSRATILQAIHTCHPEELSCSSSRYGTSSATGLDASLKLEPSS
jgi:DNA-binding transcriptional regulator YhcF (GntR family)